MPDGARSTNQTAKPTPPGPPCVLTAHEVEVLTWTARGKTSWEISCIIHRSEWTVNYHLRHAMQKLDACNKCHAVAKAISCSFLTI